MEVKTVSEAVNVTKRLVGSIRVPLDDKDTYEKLKVVHENLGVIYDILSKAEKEAAEKSEPEAVSSDE